MHSLGIILASAACSSSVTAPSPTIPSFVAASPRSPATHLLSEETSIDDAAAAATLDEDRGGEAFLPVPVRNEEFMI